MFIVRDVEAALARATQAKATIATPGGKAVTIADGARAILIRDIDGRFIELRQLATTPATPAGDILDMRLSIAVNNMDETTRVYRDVLGFTVQGETKFSGETAMRSLTGLTKAQVRRSRVQAPGLCSGSNSPNSKASTALRFVCEFRTAERRGFNCVCRMSIPIVTAVKAAGWKVMSEDGIAQPIPPNFKAALVADSNNFFLTPFAPCNGCAPNVER